MANDLVRKAATTRFFSPMILRQLAQKGKSQIFTRLVREIGLDRFEGATSVADAFDIAFKMMSSPGNRDEYVYKSAIANKVLLGRHSLRTAAMLTEVRVAENKADVVILNGTSTVYEIKSERDSLVRLPNQLQCYLQAFASVNVIVSDKFLNNVLKLVPNDVGVLVLNERGMISVVKESIDNPTRINTETMFTILRVQEAVKALSGIGVEVPIVPNTERYTIVQELFKKQDPAEMHSSVVKVLKDSRSQTPLKEVLSGLPRSLQAVALTASLNKRDWPRLIATVNTPFTEAMKWS